MSAMMSRGCLIGLFLSWVAWIPLASAQEAPPPAPAPAPVATPAPTGPDDVVVVEADGEGIDKKEAELAALRAALEKGGKNEIFSHTEVKDFQLMHDIIISRADGIVTDHKIIKGPEPVIGGGTVKVWIKARVSKKSMVDSWGAIQNLLNQVGRPKIMVYIIERIDGRPEQQSILETKIEERMLKSGFDLVDRNQINAILTREHADAMAERNLEKLKSIAKGFGAQIFVTGTANANQAGIEDLYGVPAAFYNCDVQLKVYYTDTAKVLASVGLPRTRGGAPGRKEYSPQAGKQALDFAGRRVVEELYHQVLGQWATALSAGGELTLEVEGIKPIPALRLRKMLEGLKGIEHVNMEFSKGVATYRINAKMNGDQLFERLAEGEFEKELDLSELKMNRIQAKAKEKKD
jgi:hypothetical protein